MKNFIIFAFVILFTNSAQSSELDKALCNQNDSCKKYCNLRERDKFDENNQAHEELMLDCFYSLSKNYKSQDDLLEQTNKLLAELEKLTKEDKKNIVKKK